MTEAKIIDVCEILGGKPAPKDESAFEIEGIPFVRMRDLGRYHLTTNLDTTDNKIGHTYAKTNNLKPIPKGAVLIPRSGSVALNHRAILAQDSIIVGHICACCKRFYFTEQSVPLLLVMSIRYE
jgi:type I restriction enzyme, S subunit